MEPRSSSNYHYINKHYVMSDSPIKNKVLQGKTVMIVEDDHFISRVYEKWLTIAGAKVLVAYNGALGLELLSQYKVDLMLLDLGMPGLSGYDMLTELKKKPETKDIPVIVLSNTTMKENIIGFEDIKNAGVTDILRKYETSLDEIIKRAQAYFPETKNETI